MKNEIRNITDTIILAAAKKLPKDELGFNALKREITARAHINAPLPNKTELLTAYHKLLRTKSILPNKPLAKMLTRRGVRTLSGVTIVTSLIKPYPCPGQCVYCPLDTRMPKSYLSDEPAAARALALKFDPYTQMAKRIEALESNGHPTDKIELIIKGGTWNSYPLAYQYWFTLRSFEAANSHSPLGRGRGGLADVHEPTPARASSPPRPSGELTERSPLIELKKELYKQQRLNEHAKHRIIGLTLETRPDFINEKTIREMRELGCTRVELGIQNTDDVILKLIKRGHDNARSKAAAELLKNYGFKVDFHLMPQLPGATPKSDLAMMLKVFTDPGFRPDMIKIYPCSVIKNSELYEWLKKGEYQTYSDRELINLLKEFKTQVPRYARISRLIRDIPSHHIEAGNKVTNLRQTIQAEMKKEGTKCQCLRCREVGHFDMKTINQKNNKSLKPILFVDEYEASGGKEYFLSFEDAGRNVVFGFCRLRICERETSPRLSSAEERKSRTLASTEERVGRGLVAFIRELHTYGQLIPINQKNNKSINQKTDIQHRGLGKKLMKEAEKITKQAGAKKLAVISGVGVRDYYRQLGYRLEKTYMVKKLKI